MSCGELKAGPKTQKLPVQVWQCRKNLNWILARSSHPAIHQLLDTEAAET
jgi:hypothetical protein